MRARTGPTSRLRRFLGEERGSQFVELTFVLPVLLVLFMVTAEVGRLFYTYTTLAKATSVGARYLSTADLSTTAKRDAEVAKAKNIVVCGNAAGCGGGGYAPIVSCGNENGTALANIGSGNVNITPPTGTNKTVSVAITGCYFKPLFDLGSLLHDPSFSLKIELNPASGAPHLR